ncbi:hypothetical protein AYO46_03440 [Betaproteobacteria bacterium SCGC AG-212-J23]|nr:hypothetical protein AYO46_03440 [Betaproteobacteria bacterium SCGC AG-212-J23]
MRRFVLLLAFLSCNAVAQQHKPPAMEPIPEPPPPPEPGVEQPEVRIPVPNGDKVEEIREAGRVVMLKVTPKNGGKPYYLVDTTGAGQWQRRDSLDDGVRVPMWPIWIFD